MWIYTLLALAGSALALNPDGTSARLFQCTASVANNVAEINMHFVNVQDESRNSICDTFNKRLQQSARSNRAACASYTRSGHVLVGLSVKPGIVQIIQDDPTPQIVSLRPTSGGTTMSTELAFDIALGWFWQSIGRRIVNMENTDEKFFCFDLDRGIHVTPEFNKPQPGTSRKRSIDTGMITAKRAEPNSLLPTRQARPLNPLRKGQQVIVGGVNLVVSALGVDRLFPADNIFTCPLIPKEAGLITDSLGIIANNAALVDEAVSTIVVDDVVAGSKAVFEWNLSAGVVPFIEDPESWKAILSRLHDTIIENPNAKDWMGVKLTLPGRTELAAEFSLTWMVAQSLLQASAQVAVANGRP